MKIKLRMPYFLLLASLIPLSAYGQNIGASSSWTWDQSTGSVYLYAQTTTDYSSAYYYDACVTTILGIYPASGGGSTEGGPFNCVNGSGGPIDAESSYNTTVTTALVELDFQSYHQVDATYQTYQFEPNCGDECDGYWDAFELSFLGVDDTTYPDNTS
ncbi:MAG: hypothetical protein M3Y72_17340 [Acidobacteriota bacterium]|nr:hypothetical protein [Acidobacteriota bacterium]MDQ2842764.1 hypothetical protein [Acidobacteriota bacterium]